MYNNQGKTEFSYALRLKLALQTLGYLTLLVGPSKADKITLCDSVIGLNNIVKISGSDFRDNSDFWVVIACKTNILYTEKIDRNQIIKYYKENNKVLVIDDFHFASKETQEEIVKQLKYAIRREMRIIVITSSDYWTDIVRLSINLCRKISLINVDIL